MVKYLSKKNLNEERISFEILWSYINEFCFYFYKFSTITKMYNYEHKLIHRPAQGAQAEQGHKLIHFKNRAVFEYMV